MLRVCGDMANEAGSRVVRKQYYHKYEHRGKTVYKGRYDRVRYRLEFPADFDVSDLVGKELEFERVGDEIRIRPKKLKVSTVKKSNRTEQ